MSNLDELREFIELWIPINVKDAQHVKEAKIEARNEFLDKVSQYTQQETLKARIDELEDACPRRVSKELTGNWQTIEHKNIQERVKQLRAQLTSNNSKEAAPQ